MLIRTAPRSSSPRIVRARAAAAFISLFCGAVGAVGVEPAGQPASTGIASARGGFAENLKPVVRRKAVSQMQAYVPIKKQEDQGAVPEIEMFVGESRVFPAPNVGRIAVGNGQIMTAAALDSKEVIVFANGAGTSSLFVWNADGRYQRIKINIVAGDITRVARDVAAFLAAIPHARTSIVGDKVIVDGDELSDADLSKIDQLEKRFPQIVNFTNRIGWEQMVMMDVKVVEFPKSELREIGLKWSAVGGSTFAGIWSPLRVGNRPTGAQYQVNIPAPGTGLPITSPNTTGAVLPSSLNLLSALNLGLNAQLNLLEQEGRASILAEPQLSARSGAKASFLAGGEFPYSVSNLNGVTIIFKPYGIRLEITPKVDRNGVIRATILSEVSSIDASVTAVGGPALLTRKTETEFNVRAGETIVLSGLLQRSSSTDVDKVPLLGDLPILGALFRSKRFQNKETELVVFVTPSVVDSQSPGLVERVNRTTERLGQRMGPQPYLSDPLQPGRPAAQLNRAPVATAIGSGTAPVSVVPAQAPAVMPVVPTPTPVPVPVPVPLPVPVAPASPAASENALPESEPRDLPIAASGTLLHVLAEHTPLRSKPSRGSPALQMLAKGTTVKLLDRPAQPPGRETWQPVMVGSVEGWVSRTAVAPGADR